MYAAFEQELFGLVLEKSQGAIPWLRLEKRTFQCHRCIRSFRALKDLTCFQYTHTLKALSKDVAVAATLD